MAESKMAEFVKLLGVELNEKFKIKFRDGSISTQKYYIDEGGLQKVNEYTRYNEYIVDLLSGLMEIVKLPWKPQKNEDYYTFATTPYECYAIVCAKWHNSFDDKMRYRNGFCYKTREEAEADLPRAEKYFNSDDIIDW